MPIHIRRLTREPCLADRDSFGAQLKEAVSPISIQRHGLAFFAYTATIAAL